MKKQMILLTLFLATQSAWASWSSPVYERMCYFNQSANDETQRDLFPCQIHSSGSPWIVASDGNTSHWKRHINISFQDKLLGFYGHYSSSKNENGFFSLKKEIVKETLNDQPAKSYSQNHDLCYRSEEWDICIHQPNLIVL